MEDQQVARSNEYTNWKHKLNIYYTGFTIHYPYKFLDVPDTAGNAVGSGPVAGASV